MALPHGTTGSLGPTFVTARPVGLAVKPAYALALEARLPTALSRPLHSSVTFWEESAPDKLPTKHCPPPGFTGRGEATNSTRVVFQGRLPDGLNRQINASHLSYACDACGQYHAAVKVHGVFPSCRGYVVSSPQVQFHRVRPRDSAPVVSPFMRVGTYPTRNFATLGPS
jgi:hypothetical protein